MAGRELAMTVDEEVARVQYAGSGSTGPFSFNFKLFDEEHISVVKTVSGVDTTLTLTTHYSVTLAADFSSATVTLVTALAVGETLTLVRDPPLQQQTAWPRNDPFPSATHERAADLAVMLLQRLNEKIGRSLLLPESSTLSGLVIPNPVANTLLGWNSAADNFENVTVASLGAVSLPASPADNELIRANGTSGDVYQGTGVTISDALALAGLATIVLTGAAGLDVNPGSDADADLLSVIVSGSPRMFWDESQDRFAFTHGLELGTALAIACGTLELGHASDTTLSRSAAGIVAVEGNDLAQREPGRTTDTSTSYSLSNTDSGKIITMNNASANTVNIQANGGGTANYPANMICEIKQLGAGVTTIQAPSGVTLNGVTGGGADISAQYASAVLFREASDTWIIDGAHGGVS
jgi:hypothetical protein